MDNLFYFLGVGLTLLALVVSFSGIRFKDFPSSRAQMVGGLTLMVALVAGTLVFAVVLSANEQSDRNDEKAAERAQVPEGDQDQLQGVNSYGEPAPAAEGSGEPGVRGSEVFASSGCGSCHTLSAAGTRGMVGPDLDARLVDKDANFIRQSIVDPQAEVEPGYPAGTMPQTYGERLSPEDLNALVGYLLKSTRAPKSP